MLRVAGVLHYFYGSAQAMHTINVYTEEVDDAAKLLTTGNP